MGELDYGPELKTVTFFPPAGDTDPRMADGFWRQQNGLLSESAAIFRQMLAADPTHIEAHHFLGLTLLRQGKNEEAIAELRAALGPKAPPVYYVNLAMALYAARQLDAAVELLQQACRVEPENVDYNTRLAALQLAAGHVAKAAATVERSLAFKPMDIQAMETARKIAERQHGQTPQAPKKNVSDYDYTLTISGRRKQEGVAAMLRETFAAVPLKRIDSVFGFNAPCRLYGGRQYSGPEVTDADLEWMYQNSIGYRIPLTNTLATDADYNASRPFLERHHRAGNSVILYKDSFAKAIRKDFPLYKIEASVIRGADTADKVLKALEIFDTVVPLPEAFNTNYKLLESFSQDVKDRIRLFLNVGCAYHCPRRICYGSFSKMNLQQAGATFECSQLRLSYHFTQGMVDFPIERFLERGYRKFKLLRGRLGVTGY